MQKPSYDPFSGAILQLENAFLVPERSHDQKHAFGVLNSDLSYCELSRSWIRARKPSQVPVLGSDELIEHLSGRHLFAGHMRGHFGHFLVESTARLWALDESDLKIESVIYLPFQGRVNQTRQAIKRYQGFFDALGIDVPVRTVSGVSKIEELIVPELGFGWSERYAGSPRYQGFMRQNLGAHADGRVPLKLYISRARLNPHRGGVLCETVIEENLRAQGYEIFSPEKHPLKEQISMYSAASHIVALDGSALHLAACVAKPEAKVAIILRRSKSNVADYVLQYKSFCGISPVVVDVYLIVKIMLNSQQFTALLISVFNQSQHFESSFSAETIYPSPLPLNHYQMAISDRKYFQ